MNSATAGRFQPDRSAAGRKRGGHHAEDQGFVVAGLALLALMPSAVRAELEETIAYRIDDKEFTGYLAYDDAVAGKRPGVLVVHEVWGQNDYIRKRAEMLAGLGYTAFALDMYGGGQVADHPDSAKAFRQAVMSDLAVAAKRFDAAKAVLRRQPTVDGENVAAIGYCMGGSIVLHMARVGGPRRRRQLSRRSRHTDRRNRAR